MKTICLLFLCSFLLYSSYAQKKPDRAVRYSIDAGLGLYNTFASPQPGINGKGSNGISYQLSTAVFYNKNIIKITYLKHDESVLSGFAPFGPSPDELFIDMGFLYGKRIYKQGNTTLNFLAGPGFTKGTIRGKYIPYNPPRNNTANSGMNDWFGPLNFNDDYEIEKIFTPSFFQELEFASYPSKYFGIGASAALILNGKNSHFGFFAKLCFGKFK